MSVFLNQDQLAKIVWNGNEPIAFQCSGAEETTSFLLDESNLSAQSMLDISGIEQRERNSCFLKLPPVFMLEAVAFGGKRSGFDYSYNSIEEFLNVQPDDTIKQEILECMHLVKDQPILFKLTGAFSALAALIEPMKLYKAMVKSPNLLHQALEKVNLWLMDYAKSALQNGATILSFADPSGLCELLGKHFYIDFVANYQLALFRFLDPFLAHAAIHICGKNSVDLQKCGLSTSTPLPCTQKNIGEELLLRAQDTNFAFSGHGCILEEGNAQKCIWKLTLIKREH